MLQTGNVYRTTHSEYYFKMMPASDLLIRKWKMRIIFRYHRSWPAIWNFNLYSNLFITSALIKLKINIGKINCSNTINIVVVNSIPVGPIPTHLYHKYLPQNPSIGFWRPWHLSYYFSSCSHHYIFQNGEETLTSQYLE